MHKKYSIECIEMLLYIDRVVGSSEDKDVKVSCLCPCVYIINYNLIDKLTEINSSE